VWLDEVELALTAGEQTERDGFSFALSPSGEAEVTSLATGVKLSLSIDGHSWKVTVPNAYRRSTLGLCGTCDGDCDNDFWDGAKVL